MSAKSLCDDIAAGNVRSIEGKLANLVSPNQKYATPSGEVTTPLHRACEVQNLQIVNLLLKYEANPNATDSDCATPLHVAALVGNLAICKALVAAGANPIAKNSRNRTPRNQPKCPSVTKDYLYDIEEAHKNKIAQKVLDTWGEKIRQTQTESAFGVGVL